MSHVSNSPRTNVFPAGVANFGKAMYRSLERSTQETWDGFFWYSAQASFSWPRVDLARLLRRAYSANNSWQSPYRLRNILVQYCLPRYILCTFSAFLDYILRVCQTLRDSFFYLGKLHWFLYLLLSYCYDPGMFISVGVRISWKKLC